MAAGGYLRSRACAPALTSDRCKRSWKKGNPPAGCSSVWGPNCVKSRSVWITVRSTNGSERPRQIVLSTALAMTEAAYLEAKRVGAPRGPNSRKGTLIEGVRRASNTPAPTPILTRAARRTRGSRPPHRPPRCPDRGRRLAPRQRLRCRSRCSTSRAPQKIARNRARRFARRRPRRRS
jgi:hypothetical protein